MPSKPKMEVLDLSEQKPQKETLTNVPAQASVDRKPPAPRDRKPPTPPRAFASPVTKPVPQPPVPRTPTTTSYPYFKQSQSPYSPASLQSHQGYFQYPATVGAPAATLGHYARPQPSSAPPNLPIKTDNIHRSGIFAIPSVVSPSTPTAHTTVAPSRPLKRTSSAQFVPLERKAPRVEKYDHKQLMGYFSVKLTGCRHYDGEAMQNRQLRAVRYPNDKNDRNAIQIHDDLGRTIGQVETNMASKLAPAIDRNAITVLVYVTGRKGTFESPIVLKTFGPFDPIRRGALLEEFRSVGLNSLGENDVKQYSERFPFLADTNNNAVLTPPRHEPHAFDDDDEDFEAMLGRSLAFDPRLIDLTGENYGTSEDVLENMPMATTPVQLSTSLLPYQRQGLAWMLKQEYPELPEANSSDSVQLWKRKRTNQFYNIATGQITATPTLASGGILADDMGLGKTLQVISLILAARQPLSMLHLKPTLIVCPAGVMSNWEDQIAAHVKEEHSLDVYRYHGPYKRDTASWLNQKDVIITTYKTLYTDYVTNQGAIEKGMIPPNGLYSIPWRRVVLDEGHNIRNPARRTAHSAYSLRADSRWSLTGTPIVNGLTDLYSQVRFLRLSGGLEQFDKFRMYLIEPLKHGGENEKAHARTLLQTLMSASCLRRRKDMRFLDLKLPERSSHLLRIRLTQTEQQKYNALQDEARSLLTLYRDEEGEERRRLYVNILEVLLRLRQCCNHWRLCEKRMNGILQLLDSTPIAALTDENIKLLQALLQVQVESEEVCSICLNTLGDRDPVVTVCKHCFCRPCLEEWFRKRNTCPLCRQASGVRNIVGPAEPVKEEENLDIDSEDSSSKINALLSILTARGQSPGTKTVVFSQWTSFLNIFEKHLGKRLINFARIDGTKKPAERDEAVKLFTEDKSCTVMLASLSVCSVGLNLVAANQVILADSWWAPAVEDQAVDRVYRLGQTRQTTVWRIVVENSIEERVLEVQKKKRELMSAAFREKESGLSREARIADIQRLISS